MADRAALITGGSGGIGMAIATALGGEGYGVTISARRPEKLERAAEKLSSYKIDVHQSVADVAQEDQIVEMVRSHKERFGRLDVLVNNAGIGIGGAIEDLSAKKLDIQLDVNLRATYLATREALPLLKEAGEETGNALIVNIASIAGKSGQGWLAAYSAAKAGVIGLTEATQMELGESGVKSCAICPGFVDTPMTDWVKKEVPPENMIRPEDVAGAVLFLLSTSRNCVVPEIVMKRPGAPV